MSFANPTRLRIGMHGEFDGTDFRLIGRVVMGAEFEGEICYWNEFNLEAADGSTADLVYEETERGGEWRIFKLFEPEYPMTAADAATKHKGDLLNLTGTEVRVTLKDISRVYRIEGQAPEGVEVGDVAHYFNAEARGIMQVVSWTGDEIEFYNGVQLSPLVVENAFKLPKLVPAAPFKGFSRDSSSDEGSSFGFGKFIFWAVILIVVFFQFNNWNFSCVRSREAAPVKHLSAPKPPLMTGATGAWNGKNLHLTAHAVMEIGEVGAIFERHEYELLDDDGNASLLICGEQAGSTNWTYFTPLAPYPLPTPQQAAAQKAGDIVNVDGVIAPVCDLFQSTVRGMDNVAPTLWRQGDVSFGYLARAMNYSLLARWNSVSARFYRGTAVSPKEFSAAFSGK